MQNRKVAWAVYVVCFLLIWNILEFIYTVFLTGTPWHFTIGQNGGLPLIIALVSGYFLIVRRQRRPGALAQGLNRSELASPLRKVSGTEFLTRTCP